MKHIKIDTHEEVKEKFNAYPEYARDKLLGLRRLIIEAAHEHHISHIQETLKWNEPSYLTHNGSTIRMDWKSKAPDHYALYFQCTSQLVPTFKALYPNNFNYEGTRAIVFHMDDNINESAVKHCIGLALRYHSLKHHPLLGQ